MPPERAGWQMRNGQSCGQGRARVDVRGEKEAAQTGPKRFRIAANSGWRKVWDRRLGSVVDHVGGRTTVACQPGRSSGHARATRDYIYVGLCPSRPNHTGSGARSPHVLHHVAVPVYADHAVEASPQVVSEECTTACCARFGSMMGLQSVGGLFGSRLHTICEVGTELYRHVAVHPQVRLPSCSGYGHGVMIRACLRGGLELVQAASFVLPPKELFKLLNKSKWYKILMKKMQSNLVPRGVDRMTSGSA